MNITADTQRSARPVMTWIEVPDARGGTRLEARWAVPGLAVPQVPLVSAAHAA